MTGEERAAQEGEAPAEGMAVLGEKRIALGERKGTPAEKKIALGEREIPCEILRSRRKTMSLQIREDGALLMRLPLRVTEKEAFDFAGRHGDWILKNYKKALENREKRREYSREEMEAYRERLRPVLAGRTAYFAALLSVDYGRISIRDQKTRWGSCSCKGNLNFNWKLALAPPEILDYVVVHELAHRLEMNHSKAFWIVVERILPDYRERRKWLKEKGGTL